MSALAIIGIGILFVIAVGWSLYEFFGDARRFLAPDNTDRDTINVSHGEGTPEAGTALDQRFGRASHWRDAATGMIGLTGMLVLLWLWFG